MPRLCVLPACALGLLAVCAGCRRPPAPNVLWITLGGLRADRLGAYGYARDTDPYFANVIVPLGRLYEGCRGAAEGAPSGVAQIVSGRTPSSLLLEGHPLRDPRQPRLLSAAFTFAELLRLKGYRCAAFSHARWIGPADRGFAQGFEVFALNRPGAMFPVPQVEEWRKGAVFYDALQWIREEAGNGPESGPWFAWIYSAFNLPPLDLPPRYVDRWDDEGRLKDTDIGVLGRYHRWDRHVFTEDEADAVGALYDAAVSYTDEWLDLLFGALSAIPTGRPMIVVISGDAPAPLPAAGCPLVPCDVALADDRVPLLIVAPRGAWARERDPDPATPAGIAPTVLHLMGLRRPRRMDGGLLLPVSKGDMEPRALQ